jgi:glycosyltransferase involved in cell wall biosynthesis
MRNNNKKVIIIGSYPPPIGGVSVHIQRLLQHLYKSSVDCLCFDTSGVKNINKEVPKVLTISWRKAILHLLTCEKGKILHFHNFSFKNIFVYFILSFRHTIILSLHNERFLDIVASHGNIINQLAILLINRISYIVVDNKGCVALAEKIIKEKRKIFMIPEFIPPIDFPPMDNKEILYFREKHHYLLSSNAFQITFYKGQDLYGLDILVQLMDKLVNGSQMNVGLVFLLPNIADEKYYNYIELQIEKLNLRDHFLFITEPFYNASALWKMSEAVVRATTTDGNSITVMEALSLGVPVVASDCTERPEGVILFETRNVDDLYDKILKVLLNQQYYRNKIEGLRYENNANKFSDLYQSIAQCAK